LAAVAGKTRPAALGKNIIELRKFPWTDDVFPSIGLPRLSRGGAHNDDVQAPHRRRITLGCVLCFLLGGKLFFTMRALSLYLLEVIRVRRFRRKGPVACIEEEQTCPGKKVGLREIAA
jgi:hypothetical protein